MARAGVELREGVLDVDVWGGGGLRGDEAGLFLGAEVEAEEPAAALVAMASWRSRRRAARTTTIWVEQSALLFAAGAASTVTAVLFGLIATILAGGLAAGDG
ncbi:hypothetical protein HPP92_024734 [Vanilla planifolia]|uniref:Uncharacterized protein n=1 Tax=Vanilla planifolia TaxID=51239 RepID=A0A835U9Y6_VANPL|nr:hypothetical protein HPP92_024734 [Vanilla planifolia]